MSLTTKLTTYKKLGLANVIRVVLYRLCQKSGQHKAQKLKVENAPGPFLRASERRDEPPPTNTDWDDNMCWFGWHHAPLPDTSPDWFANQFSAVKQPNASRDWWQIPDFGTGDIKGLWELSRFDWVIAWATKAAQGDGQTFNRLNNCREDWTRENPPYKRPNWKCGQDVSFRVVHLVTAAWMLGQEHKPQQGIVKLPHRAYLANRS